MSISKDVTELIGNTPLVFLDRATEGCCARIAAKMEFFNPGCSVKDRIALSMILDAEKRKLIAPGRTVLVEATSGNTGIGLAMLAARKGYKIILIMPHKCSSERKVVLLQLGAKVVLSDASKGFRGVMDKLEEVMQRIPNSFSLSQFDNKANPEAHFLTTGPEIWNDTDGKVDIFVAGAGTGGTFSGVTQYLKSKNPAIHAVVVEPEESAIISGCKPGYHRIQGVGLPGLIPNTMDLTLVDEIFKVHSDDAVLMAKTIAEKEGILVGISSGCALKAAMEIGSRKENDGKLIIVVFPSGGERYISTELFDSARFQAEEMKIDHVLDPKFLTD